MTTLAIILASLFGFFLIFELGGMHFLISEYYKNKFSEERFRNILRINKVNYEELTLFMHIYKLIANTDPSNYNVHNNAAHIESVYIKNVSFLCEYDAVEKQYSLISMIFYKNPKKDSVGTEVNMLASKFQIGDFIIGFIVQRLYKYWDENVKKEAQKITDKYHQNIQEVNKFF